MYILITGFIRDSSGNKFRVTGMLFKISIDRFRIARKFCVRTAHTNFLSFQNNIILIVWEVGIAMPKNFPV